MKTANYVRELAMENRLSPSTLQEQQGRTLLLFLVVIGYLVTFIGGVRSSVQYSIARLVIGISLGAVYLVVGMFDVELFRRFSLRVATALYFSIQLILVLAIGLVLGPGGTWLIGMPLSAVAVERLSPRLRWFVYTGILAAIILPIVYHSTLDTALMNVLFISPAIFFVALISQIRLNEQHAREKAEGLARQLEIANRQLAEYASQAEELAATQERNRLAREIHDTLGHYLTIVNVQIEAAKVTCQSDPLRALDALNKAQELARKGLMNVRESVAALRVSPVENRPLEESLAELIEETQASGVTTKFKIIGTPQDVESKSALALYRVVQEGLTNVRKHANASHADIELDFSHADEIRLTLRDDGAGAADTSGGFGLIGLRERVHLLDGEFKVESQPGHGFAIEVTLPLTEGEIV
jgi:signal transduction histidine kinase